MKMNDLGAAVQADTRNAGIDAARIAATLLVVFHHTAITYGAIGGWYYKEVATDRSLSSILLILFCTFNQAWFMGLFFLLAGYFTPRALAAKGPWRFLRDRLQRLGIPLAFYVLVLGPITVALAQTANDRAFGDTLLWMWSHREIEIGPLWFAWALLIFAGVSVLWHAVASRRATNPVERKVPSNGWMLGAAIVTGLVAFALRLVWPVGTTAWGLQLGYFASYVTLFAAGCLAASARWLETWPAAQVKTWKNVARVALPVLPIVLLGGGALGLQGRPQGGWSVPALVYALWEPFVAWGVILVLLKRCQLRFQQLGSVGARLARRAFTIFVIHPPVVVAVTLAWRQVPAPALLKFAVSGSVACVLCYLLAGALLRVPGVRRVL